MVLSPTLTGVTVCGTLWGLTITRVLGLGSKLLVVPFSCHSNLLSDVLVKVRTISKVLLS